MLILRVLEVKSLKSLSLDCDQVWADAPFLPGLSAGLALPFSAIRAIDLAFLGSWPFVHLHFALVVTLSSASCSSISQYLPFRRTSVIEFKDHLDIPG